LFISPKASLSINGTTQEYSVGDKLYEHEDRTIYLGFIGNNGTRSSPDDLYIRLISIPKSRGGTLTTLEESDVLYMADFDKGLSGSDVRKNVYAEILDISQISLAGSRQGLKGFFSGKRVGYLHNNAGEKEISGTKVKIIGYAGIFDSDLEQAPEEVRENYANAMEDYETIRESLASERWPQNTDETTGEKALRQAISLANYLGQRRAALELCQEFSENYEIVAPNVCNSEYLLSNTEISGQGVLVNGRTHLISFEGVREPGFDEFGLEIMIDGKTEQLSKNEIFYFAEEPLYSYNPELPSTAGNVYYRYNNDKWQWSTDRQNWMDSNEFVVRGGRDNGETLHNNHVDVVERLETLDLDNGASYLLDLEAKDETFSEYIQLTGLESDTATLKVNLLSSIASRITQIPTQKIQIGREETFNSQHVFSIQNINLKKTAKVTLEPEVDYAKTNATFNFRIGIEKRGIQLSPEKTTEKIRSLNNTIKKLEEISNTLGSIVSTGKTVCAATAGALTLKNFFSNLGGKGIARQKAMRDKNGWYDQCQKEVNSIDSPYDDIESCLLDNSDEIEATVNSINAAMESQNARINELEEGISTQKFLGEKVVDTDALAERFIDDSANGFKAEISSCASGQILIGGKSINKKDVVSRINSNTTSFTQARDLQLQCRLLNSEGVTGEIANAQIDKILGEIYSNSEADTQRTTFETKSQGDINNPVADSYAGKNQKEGIYRGSTAKAGNRFGLAEGTPVQLITYFNQEYTLELEGISSEGYRIKNIYDESAIKLDLTKNPALEITKFFSRFKIYDSNSYKNEYSNPLVRYYETDPYRGLPAVVPFDVKEGWYAAVKSNLPIFGGLRAYDDSARVSSFYVCNVGKNGREEFIGGDDDCRGFVPNANQPLDFPGLDEEKSRDIVNRAVRAIESATDQYEKGDYITINNQRIKVGEPAADIPDIQCEDFMSPTDCNIMFNVCDPFICPSSRCDLGGSYPVKDVVQSGIIGSLALCLPNFPEVKIPICVTGVNAGVEAWTSVWQSYQQCLQTSLDTGSTVGICDEINSVYMCDFIWRQGLPIVKYGAPKVISSILGQNVRGGGEYLGVQDAIDNAGKSFDYFTQYYADDAFRAFKARSAEDVGTELCRAYPSFVGPQGGNLLDAFTAPDSPSQFYGRFEEIQYTTATNPPTSQYKVFYHIYAGKDYPAYFQVYLRGTGGSFYRDADFRRPVASGFIATGDFKTETRDFTAPSGYKELCIVVNGQEECGFKEVTTEFGIDYLTEKYVADQASQTDITSEKNCISGSSDSFTLLNPNIQAGVEETLNPAIYNRGIIRVCSTGNPGQATDSKKDTINSRWKDVGYCDTENLRCWLDTSSVKDVIKNTNIEEQILGETEEKYIDALKSQGKILADFDSFDKQLRELQSQDRNSEIISAVNENINKVINNNQISYLYLFRGNAYSNLARLLYNSFQENRKQEEKTEEKEAEEEQTGTQTPDTENPEEEPEESYTIVGLSVLNNRRSTQEVSNTIALLASQQGIVNSRCRDYAQDIFESARDNGIPDPLLLLSLMQQESACDKNAVNDISIGLMQINQEVHCGKNGLPSNADECKQALLTNTELNINTGAKILSDNYKKGSAVYRCRAFSSENQNEPSVDVQYTGWASALRRYNGLGCANYRQDGSEIFADHGFVEEISERYNSMISGEA